MLNGRIDAPVGLSLLDAKMESSQDSQVTGWTDSVKRGIGAFNVLCSRDDVKRVEAKSLAPVEPVVRRSIPSVQWRQQKRDVQRLVQFLVSDRLNRRYPMQRHRFNRWFAVFCWPLVQRLQDLVAYIYMILQPFEDCWSPKTSHTHPRTPPNHPKA